MEHFVGVCKRENQEKLWHDADDARNECYAVLKYLGCYKTNPLRMNLVPEIRIGQQIGVDDFLEVRPHVPKQLLQCGDSTGLCKT